METLPGHGPALWPRRRSVVGGVLALLAAVLVLWVQSPVQRSDLHDGSVRDRVRTALRDPAWVPSLQRGRIGLEDFGSEAVPFLIEAIERPGGSGRAYALLHSILPRFLGQRLLLPAPNGPHEVRMRAYEALRHLGDRARGATPFLLGQITNATVFSEVAVLALMDTKPEVQDVVPALYAAFRTGGPRVRFHSALALAGIDTNGIELVEGLVADLKASPGSQTLHPRNACYLLGRIGPQAKAAVPALVVAWSDPALRDIAVEALRRIDPQALIKLTNALPSSP